QIEGLVCGQTNMAQVGRGPVGAQSNAAIHRLDLTGEEVAALTLEHVQILLQAGEALYLPVYAVILVAVTDDPAQAVALHLQEGSARLATKTPGGIEQAHARPIERLTVMGITGPFFVIAGVPGQLAATFAGK